MRPWQLGNTTVRSPFRLRDGLIALSHSTLQGNLHGEDQEKAFRKLLGEHGIVSLGTDETYSVGRKWRSALVKLGFLTPDLSKIKDTDQLWVGAPDCITPNGRRLIEADSVAGWQECFLRALAAYYIPSALEDGYKKDYQIFSPLRHVLRVMLEIEKQSGESRLNFIEMALILQFTSSAMPIGEIVADIVRFRQNRQAAVNKRRFDNDAYTKAAKEHGNKTGATYKDYADMNFRYLKATGLVLTKGKGITLAPEKYMLVAELIKDTSVPVDVQSQLIVICNGAQLPTDVKEPALLVLKDQIEQLSKRGIKYDIRDKKLDTAQDIGVVRHNVQAILDELNESDYAKRQATEWQEIAAYIGLFVAGKFQGTLANGEEISIPKSEAPAYFEWIIWRAFLAINKLINPPQKARRFKVDQDFLPVAPAPGNGADLIFEFESFVLGVEVTLTENSRQEAAEGESVRRHIAQLVGEYAPTKKPVYGLFSARRIDTNTIETFRSGTWYSSDQRMSVNVVPLTVKQFHDFFVALFQNQQVDNQHVVNLINICTNGKADMDAPQWKGAIDSRHIEYLQLLNS